MVGGALTEGRLRGDVLAFGMTACMAIMMLIIRYWHQIPVLPAACLSALQCSLLVWPLTSPFHLGADEAVFLFRS